MYRVDDISQQDRVGQHFTADELSDPPGREHQVLQSFRGLPPPVLHVDEGAPNAGWVQLTGLQRQWKEHARVSFKHHFERLQAAWDQFTARPAHVLSPLLTLQSPKTLQYTPKAHQRLHSRSASPTTEALRLGPGCITLFNVGIRVVVAPRRTPRKSPAGMFQSPQPWSPMGDEKKVLQLSPHPSPIPASPPR